jgi:hypothetical protein
MIRDQVYKVKRRSIERKKLRLNNVLSRHQIEYGQNSAIKNRRSKLQF